MSTHKRLRDILDAEIDFESPIDEDLFSRLVKNLFEVAQMVDGQDEQTFKASANGAPAGGVLTIDTITSGVFERDDQYNGSYIIVTSGSASGAGVNSRFPITDSDEGALTFTCGNNGLGQTLQVAGMANNDTFRVSGHVHDGTDGEVIDASQIDYTNHSPQLKKYTQAGKSQSFTSTGGHSFDNGHTLVNLPAGINLIFVDYKISVVNGGSSAFETQVEIKFDATQSFRILESEEADGGVIKGTAMFLASNTQIVNLRSTRTGSGYTFLSYDIIAYQTWP